METCLRERWVGKSKKEKADETTILLYKYANLIYRLS